MNTPIFRVFLPGHYGVLSDKAHRAFQAVLAQTFGGYTSWYAKSGWLDEKGYQVHEPVVVYEVVPIAFDGIIGHGQSAWSRFVGLCRIAGTELAQDAIYVTNSETGAQIIELKKEKAHA